MILLLNLTLIMQHMVAIKPLRFFVVMVRETMEKALEFYVFLIIIIISYTLVLALMQKKSIGDVYRVAYVLSIGETGDFDEFDLPSFITYISYTTLIALVLLNLVVGIMSEKYESVVADKHYYEGKAMLRRSLDYEEFLMLLQKKKEQSYHYIFVSR